MAYIRNCDTCEYSSYALNCNEGNTTLYCRETGYEHAVNPNHVCDEHRFIKGYERNAILGYDCDGNEIEEFRVLRVPFSADIENWEEEPNIEPRFYCLVINPNGETLAVSIYDDYNYKYIRKYEGLNESDEIPMIIKPASEMSNYEVAFLGTTGKEWYYDRDKDSLLKKIEKIGYVKSRKREQ